MFRQSERKWSGKLGKVNSASTQYTHVPCSLVEWGVAFPSLEAFLLFKEIRAYL